MNDKQKDPQTHVILGAAIEVHRTLGPGFLETVYAVRIAIDWLHGVVVYTPATDRTADPT